MDVGRRGSEREGEVREKSSDIHVQDILLPGEKNSVPTKTSVSTLCTSPNASVVWN